MHSPIYPALSRQALVMVGMFMLTPAALGQSILHAYYGDEYNAQLGTAVSGAGDVNQDGFDDLVVGAPLDGPAGSWEGRVRVYSGLDGSILHVWGGGAVGDDFGRAVSQAGDVDGDGYPDVLVGAPGEVDANGERTGTARVYSGKLGTVLYTFYGDAKDDSFGLAVSGAGDVNQDGNDDVIVGAAWSDFNGSSSGRASVFSGIDGSILYVIDGNSGDNLGLSVSGAGDSNGDGFADFVVGAPYAHHGPKFNAGSAIVYSGKNGQRLHTFRGDASANLFGWSVSGAGDVDGDGFDDLIVGAPGGNAAPQSYSSVLSGRDGSILYKFPGEVAGTFIGISVSGAGDVNRDGFDDLIVGHELNDVAGINAGSARLYSGANGAVLGTLYGYPDRALFGAAVSGAGDVDGDGFADVIIGAPNTSTPFGDRVGSAWVHSGWIPAGRKYCTPAVPNSTGLAGSIEATGSRRVADNDLFLWATNLPPDEVALFLVSGTRAFTPNPGGSQGNLCLGGRTGRFSRVIQTVGLCGCIGIHVNLNQLPLIPPHTVMKGETWHFQVWVKDQGSSNFTDAVTVMFQ